MPNDDPFLCEHPNENPNFCPCDPECYCRTRTCKDKPFLHRELRGVPEPRTWYERLDDE